MWVQIALLVASFVISYALRPKPVVPKPATLGDFNFPQSVEGTPQPMDFGTMWATDWMVLGVTNFRTSPIKKKGGKK